MVVDQARQANVLRIYKLAFTLVAGLSLLLSNGAEAQDATNTALARSLFEAGIVHTEAGEWEEAADRFERSLALHPSEVVSFNAGIALTHLDRLVEARERFRNAAGSDHSQLAEAARAQIEEVTPRIGSLEVRVAGAPPADAVVLLDGTPLPQQALEVAIPVDPTTHTISVVSAEATLAEETVTVGDGAAERVTLTVVPTPADVALQTELPPTGSDGEPTSSDDTLLIATIVGSGVIAVTIVIVVLALAFSGNHPPVEGNLGPGVLELGR